MKTCGYLCACVKYTYHVIDWLCTVWYTWNSWHSWQIRHANIAVSANSLMNEIWILLPVKVSGDGNTNFLTGKKFSERSAKWGDSNFSFIKLSWSFYSAAQALFLCCNHVWAAVLYMWVKGSTVCTRSGNVTHCLSVDSHIQCCRKTGLLTCMCTPARSAAMRVCAIG